MGVAVASAGPYANHLHLVSDRKIMLVSQQSVFTGQMPFLPPNQQRQSTKGNEHCLSNQPKMLNTKVLNNCNEKLCKTLQLYTSQFHITFCNC